ncbi:MAG: hypothetical protein J5836_03255 [Clostridia bacterium]|nr:hypothetical protein [Clostridia bacterium]
MKKFILAFLIFAASFCALPENAWADEETYSRILAEDVTLFMDADLTMPWFTLPYSYYVRILSVGSRSVKVEYKGGSANKPSVKGYIAIENLNAGKEPEAPYPNVTFSVGASCLLYKDTNFTYAETIAENSVIDFYGITYSKSGKEYAFGYVSAPSGDNYMGFIEKSSIKNFAVPRLPVEVVIPESEAVKETESEEPVKRSNALGDNLQIVIIVGISVVAISIVYLLFRPNPERAKEEALTESEFKD